MMTMTIVDYAILSIITLSFIVGLFRGLIKEAIALITWVLAASLAFTFSTPLAELLANTISNATFRMAAAFAMISIGTFIVGALISYLLRLLVNKIGLSGLDRFAGGFFGIGRGLIIIVILVMLAGITPLPKSNWWQVSILLPYFSELSLWIHKQLPDDIGKIEFPTQIEQLKQLQSSQI